MTGRLNPNFAHIKARALRRMGHDAHLLLTSAYFGFKALGDTAGADKILTTAKDEFDLIIKPFGAETLPAIKKIPYSRGEAVECNGLGDLIKVLRKKTKASLEVFSKGICHKTTLRNIETGKTKKVDIFLAEAFFQRAGRRVDPYHIFFPSSNDFDDKQDRDKVSALASLGKIKEAEELHGTLKDKKAFQDGVNLQFIKLYDALFYERKNGYDKTVIDMYTEALHVTVPKFGEQCISLHPFAFTYYEICAIDQLACCHCDMGDYHKGLDLFKQLIHNMDTFYVDEMEKGRMYATVLFHYSTCLGQDGQQTKALRIAEEGIECEQRHGRLYSLPGLFFNKAFGLMELGRRDESILWFVLSYYCNVLFDGYGWSDAAFIGDFIKGEFGILLG